MLEQLWLTGAAHRFDSTTDFAVIDGVVKVVRLCGSPQVRLDIEIELQRLWSSAFFRQNPANRRDTKTAQFDSISSGAVDGSHRSGEICGGGKLLCHLDQLTTVRPELTLHHAFDEGDRFGTLWDQPRPHEVAGDDAADRIAELFTVHQELLT